LRPSKTGADFIVEMANKFPGEVTVIALASATNVVFALRQYPSIKTKLHGVVHLGGAFFVNGNVNPSAEANIFGTALQLLLATSPNAFFISSVPNVNEFP
jgi:uridine nucleosidase